MRVLKHLVEVNKCWERMFWYTQMECGCGSVSFYFFYVTWTSIKCKEEAQAVLDAYVKECEEAYRHEKLDSMYKHFVKYGY